ncbi:hypothetical protein, conserved [Angomonas deanei]|uniref:Uncharacterized protein n=1 Tax=Angomonas deanei TaxID=59799 RepID=A0A7G2CKB9_9TRYP|nr:hypothetical protein, conserved [Angomonas deanei]
MHSVGSAYPKKRRPNTALPEDLFKPDRGFTASYRSQQSRRRSLSLEPPLPHPVAPTVVMAGTRHSSAPPGRHTDTTTLLDTIDWCPTYPTAPPTSSKPIRAVTASVRPPAHAASLTLSNAKQPDHYSVSPYTAGPSYANTWGARPVSHSSRPALPNSYKWTFLTKEETMDAPPRMGSARDKKKTERKPPSDTSLPSLPSLKSGETPSVSAPYRGPSASSQRAAGATASPLTLEEWTRQQQQGAEEATSREEVPPATADDRYTQTALSINQRKMDKLEKAYEALLQSDADALQYSKEERERMLRSADSFAHHDVRLQSANRYSQYDVELEEEEQTTPPSGKKAPRPRAAVQPSAVLPMQPAWRRAAEREGEKQKMLVDLSKQSRNSPDTTWATLSKPYTEEKSVEALLAEQDNAVSALEEIEKANERSFNNLLQKYE